MTRNKVSWTEGYMLSSTAEDPEREIVEHFKEVFHDADRLETLQQLQEIAQNVEVPSVTPFTESEVITAFHQGKRGKAVRPDGVSLELMLGLIENPITLGAFVSYFNGILTSGRVPECWNTSVATLLPKVLQPTRPKEMRPITLAGHTSKAFARLLLNRVKVCLQPTGKKQMACSGRQPADLVWSAVHMSHLAREWGADMQMIKLDLRRAFDSVYRIKLAERVQSWCQQGYPGETRCLIQMLAAADLIPALPWGCRQIHSNTGVTQGATESPLLFGKLVDEILNAIPIDPDSLVFGDLEEGGGCFMDDIIGWMKSLHALQKFLNALLPKLREFGLFVQPPKCKLLSTKCQPGAHLVLDGYQLFRMPAGEPLMIMNLPVAIEATDKHIMEHLLDRARSKFFGILHILTSNSPLRSRMRFLRTVVYGVLRWVVGILFPSKQLQVMLDQFECSCVRKMMGFKRRPGELWIDFERRSLRAARLMIFHNVGERWGMSL